MFRFLHRNPRDLLPVLVIQEIWDFQKMSFDLSTPKYQAQSTISSVWLWSEYVVGNGNLNLVICIT